MNKIKKLATIPLAAVAILGGGAAAGYATLAGAQTTTGTATNMSGMMQRALHVDGTITAINGSTVTITADANHGGGTYTIDASGATVTKAGAASSLSSFAVGDKIWAAGTISGTSVTATTLSDAPAFGKGMGMMGGHGRGPGVMGTVSAVNGSTITVTGKDGQTYTVEANGATVQRMITGSLSDVTVGDTIGVRGTVSGTSVTATEIMDDLPANPPAQQ